MGWGAGCEPGLKGVNYCFAQESRSEVLVLENGFSSSYQVGLEESLQLLLSNAGQYWQGMREKDFFCNNYQGFHFVLDYFISPWKAGSQW